MRRSRRKHQNGQRSRSKGSKSLAPAPKPNPPWHKLAIAAVKLAIASAIKAVLEQLLE